MKERQQEAPRGKYKIFEEGELADLVKANIAERPNPSGIEPIEFKVLVRPKKAEERTKGGIVLPEQVVEKDQHAAMEGEVIAMSPLAFTYEEWPAGSRKPEVGDVVVFARYAGITVKGNDTVEYRLMNDKDIVAVRRAL